MLCATLWAWKQQARHRDNFTSVHYVRFLVTLIYENRGWGSESKRLTIKRRTGISIFILRYPMFYCRLTSLITKIIIIIIIIISDPWLDIRFPAYNYVYGNEVTVITHGALHFMTYYNIALKVLRAHMLSTDLWFTFRFRPHTEIA
jgi:hypothetical protein